MTYLFVDRLPKRKNGLWFLLAIVLVAVGISCSYGDRPPPPDPIVEAAVNDLGAIILTGDGRLVRLSNSGGSVEVLPAKEKVICFFADGEKIWFVDKANQTWTWEGPSVRAVGSRIPTEMSITSIEFADADHGWATFAFGLYKTENGGATWAYVRPLAPEIAQPVRYSRANGVGWALMTNGIVGRTDDGGASWTILRTGSDATARTILPLENGDTLVGFEHGGGILRYSPAEKAPTQILPEEYRKGTGIVGLSLNSKGEVLITGTRYGSLEGRKARGVLYVYDPTTMALESVENIPKEARFIAASMSDQQGYLISSNNVFFTTDFGSSWRSVYKP